MTLLYLTFAWLGGIALAYLLWSVQVAGCATPGWPFGAVAALALGATLLLHRDRQRRLAAAIVLMAALGAWRYQVHPAQACIVSGDLAYLHAGLTEPVQAVVEGVVVAYPEQPGGKAIYRLRADSATLHGVTRPVRGDVRVYAPAQPLYRYGDRLRVTGELQNPPVYDDFDYRAYLARQGIHSIMRRTEPAYLGGGEGGRLLTAIYGLRERASIVLDRLLPQPYAALANGMLLGIESSIPDEVDDAFRIAGATHVIVISGSNVALLAGVLLALLGRVIGRTRAVIPVVVIIGLYVVLVGAEPSALRAGLMGILFVIAIGLGRQSTAWVSLAASALLMTIINPLALWDVGFQISFAATLGLIFCMKPISEWIDRLMAGRFAGEGAPAPLRGLADGAATALATQALVLPVLLYHFGRFSLISPLTNALIVPAQPPILAGGMAALIAGMIWEPLGRVLAVIPWLFLTYTTEVVRLTAQVPHASLDAGSWERTAALIYTAALAGGLGLTQLARSGWLALPRRSTLALTAAAALPLWLGATAASALPDGRLHIAFLPGTETEAIRITTPEGRQIWVGEDAPDGMLRPNLIIGPGQTGALGVDPARLDPHAAIQIGEGITLEKLGDAEDWALVLSYGDFRTLLPFALDAGSQAALIAGGESGRFTALKLPEPGTGAWPAPEFLQAAAPQVVLWPEGTTYPPGTTASLAGLKAARLPPEAIAEIVTDGQRVWLKAWSNGRAAAP